MYEVKYTEEQLNKCGISFLRNYARELGGAPKLMNKSELIGYILDIQNKTIVPQRKNSGRKPLSSSGVSYGAFGMVDLKFRDRDAETETFKGTPNAIRGFFERTSDGMGIVGGAAVPVYVSRAFIDRYFLKDGDFIVGKCERAIGGAVVLFSIDEINGSAPEDAAARANFDKARAIYPSVRVSFSAMGAIGKAIDLFCPVGKGQRAVFKLRAGDDEISLAENVVTAFKKEGVKTVACYLNSRPEDGDFLESVCDEAIGTVFVDDSEVHKKTVFKALDRAKNIVENGEDALLILVTLESMQSALGEDFERTVKILFSAAKNTENCKSLSIIALTFSTELFNRFEPFANCMAALDGNALDLSSSYTRRGEIMLSERERAVREKFKEYSGADATQKVKAAIESAKRGEELSAIEKLF